eukprot:m.181912 g.181912  ORF g.181912 m.181912 type:complete len:537 (-) comp32087_c0_seq4:67-1677(-)
MVDRCTTVVNDSGEQVRFEQTYKYADGSTSYMSHQMRHGETIVCSVPKQTSVATTNTRGEIQESSTIIKLSQMGFVFADKLWSQSTHHRNCTALRQCVQTLLHVDNRLAIGKTSSELPCLPLHAWVLIFSHLKSTDFITLPPTAADSDDVSDDGDDDEMDADDNENDDDENEDGMDVDVDVDVDEKHTNLFGPKREGLMFQGAMYTIIRDPENPPLSAVEMNMAITAVRSVVEGGAPVPRPTDSKAKQKMWEYVTQQIGRSHTSPRVVNTIAKMTTDASCRNLGRQKWRDVLSSHPKRPIFLQTFSKEEILKFVKDRDMKMVIYHRALDRFPGGNADIIIAKHEVVWKQNPRGKLQPKITASQFRNWDGSSSFSGQVSYPASVCIQMEKKVIPAIIKLLSNNNNNDENDDSDADEADVLFECTVACQQKDSEEYDTEWSSIDICLYTTGGDESVLFTRVHQYAVLNNQYRSVRGEEEDEHPATPDVQLVLDGIESIFHMGRPERFSENETPGSKRLNAAVGDTSLEWHGYIMPVII